MTITLAPADFRAAVESALDDCNADTLRTLIFQAQRIIDEECCENCGGLGAGDDFCPVCPECLDAANKAFQDAHEDCINEAADHKRRMREER